jgi:hypothetical protein
MIVFLRRVATVLLSLMVLGSVFLPWADAGVALGTESIFGFEIPVLGLSAATAALVLVALSVAGALQSSRWWWVGASLVATVMLTSAGVTLAAIDVVDSAAVEWIVEVLPQSVEDASPSISASFGLWAMIGLLFSYGVLAAYLTVRQSARAPQKLSSS